MAARSYNINLINKTGQTLHRVAHRLCHGEWETEPPEGILPDHVGKWCSRSGGDIPILGSIGTGTEGWARYRVAIPLPAIGGLGGLARSSTEGMTIIWNNPFLGDTQAWGAPKYVPVPCEDKPASPSTFQPVHDGGAGLLDLYSPDWSSDHPDSLAPGQYASPSNVALLYIAPPLFVFGIGNNVAYAMTTLAVRQTPTSQQQQPLQPEFVPVLAIKRVAPVAAAALDAWAADWTGKSAEGVEVCKVRVRRHDADRLSVHVDDLSGYQPATFDVIEAPVTGLTFPYVDDVVTSPSQAGMSQPQTTPNVAMQYHPSDPHDVARARNLENNMARRFTTPHVDRVTVFERAAVEIYGAYEDGASKPASWKLRYVRWDSRGKTLIDLLCHGMPVIK